MQRGFKFLSNSDPILSNSIQGLDRSRHEEVLHSVGDVGVAVEGVSGQIETVQKTVNQISSMMALVASVTPQKTNHPEECVVSAGWPYCLAS